MTRTIRSMLVRWHRRLGLTAALFLIWLSLSGVLLNHTSFFGLAKTTLPTSLASSVFPIPTSHYFEIDHSLGRFTKTNNTLLLNDQAIAQCEGDLLGIVSLSQNHWIGCSKHLILLEKNGAYLESHDQFFGLPTPLTQVGQCEQTVCAKANNTTYSFNNTQAQWLKFDGEVSWQQAIKKQQRKELDPSIHNWERFILEAHSGRLFGGNIGVLIFDLIALFCILLALSGCYVWWADNKRRRNK